MKRNERMICLVMTFLLCLGLAAGCGREEETDPAQIEGTYLCFVNNDGDGLVREEYEIKGDSTEEEIEDVLRAMKEEPDSIDYKSAFPENVQVTE